jgi:hypothetical protein
MMLPPVVAQAASPIVLEHSTDWPMVLATLLAVVVGGAITVGGQWYLTHRREKGRATAAARVIQGNLSGIASILQQLVDHDPQWYPYYNDTLVLQDWREYQGVLALHLDDASWEKVSQCAMGLTHMTNGMKRLYAGLMHGVREPVLVLNDLTKYREMWAELSEAHRALAALARLEPEKAVLLHAGTPNAMAQDVGPSLAG